MENKGYEVFADKVVHLGVNVAIYVTKLIFFKEDVGTDLQDLSDL